MNLGRSIENEKPPARRNVVRNSLDKQNDWMEELQHTIDFQDKNVDNVLGPPLPLPLPVQPPSVSPRKKVSNKQAISALGIHTLDNMDQQQFDNLMQSAIRNDSSLYQKVLRYEPIEFNQFVYLAMGQGIPTGRLVKKLRQFLDNSVSFQLKLFSR